MSEGIFGKNADLAQRLKDRIAFHANEHRHTYEIGKGVMDALVLDLLADFRDAGGVILPVKPNGTVWLIRRRRVVSATVVFVGAGADGLTSFSVLRGRLGDYCVACVEAFDQGRPNPIHADDDRVVRCDCFRPIPEPEEEEQKEGEGT